VLVRAGSILPIPEGDRLVLHLYRPWTVNQAAAGCTQTSAMAMERIAWIVSPLSLPGRAGMAFPGTLRATLPGRIARCVSVCTVLYSLSAHRRP